MTFITVKIYFLYIFQINDNEKLTLGQNGKYFLIINEINNFVYTKKLENVAMCKLKVYTQIMQLINENTVLHHGHEQNAILNRQQVNEVRWN